VSSSSVYLDPIVIPLVKGRSVLDVGCGYGRWGSLIRNNYWEAGLDSPPVVDAVDAFSPNVELARKSGVYRNVWLAKLPERFPEGEWDTVLACEIIEHIPQEEVESILDKIESAAARRVIISMPNYPAYRDGGETIVGYNEYDAHLSYMHRSYFYSRGYKVLGVEFGNPMHYCVRVARKLKLPGKVFLDAIAKVFPSMSNNIVLYKDV
jgi:SAM-dependent methyltransferase